MKILQRYVLSELFGPFTMAIVVLTFVLLTTQLFRLAEYLINKGLSWQLLLEFLAALLPQIVTLTLPMALLVAVLLVFGRLSADREIMAIRTSGVNLFMLYVPVVLIGLLFTSLLFYFTNILGPDYRLRLTELKSEVTYLLQGMLEPGIWHSPDAQGDDRVSLIFSERDENARLLRVQMHLMTSEVTDTGEKEQVIVTASDGRITPLATAEALEIELRDGTIHIFNHYQPDSYTLVRFDDLRRDIRLETDRVSKRGMNVEEQNSPLLMRSLQRMWAGGASAQDRYEAQTELWQRLSMPFAALAFVLMGMPLGVIGRTSGKAAGFSVAFGLIFFYYIVMKWGVSLGLQGNPWAFWAIVSPNILLIVLGSVLMLRTSRT